MPQPFNQLCHEAQVVFRGEAHIRWITHPVEVEKIPHRVIPAAFTVTVWRDRTWVVEILFCIDVAEFEPTTICVSAGLASDQV